MKKLITLILVMALIVLMAIPILVTAATITQPPDTPGVTVPIEPVTPDTQPVIVYTTGADPPAAAVDLTPLLQAVVSLAVTLITAFLIPWIRAKYTYEQRQRIAAAYQTVVYAAEQMFGAGMGEEKLEWAIKQLGAKGFTVDRTAIEAEVKKMKGLGYAILDGVVDEVKKADSPAAANAM